MGRAEREGFLRRLGRALRGVNAVEYGRPVPPSDLDAGSTNQSASPLTVDEPPRPGPGRTRDA